jgi:hypothetical protein
MGEDRQTRIPLKLISDCPLNETFSYLEVCSSRLRAFCSRFRNKNFTKAECYLLSRLEDYCNSTSSLWFALVASIVELHGVGKALYPSHSYDGCLKIIWISTLGLSCYRFPLLWVKILQELIYFGQLFVVMPKWSSYAQT